MGRGHDALDVGLGAGGVAVAEEAFASRERGPDGVGREEVGSCSL